MPEAASAPGACPSDGVLDVDDELGESLTSIL